jgi:hypothetical protein
MGRELRLPPSPHSLVFRALAKALQNDQVLRREVKAWFDWSGDLKRDGQSLSPSLCPAVSLVPGMGPDQWEGPQGMTSDLVVSIGVAVAGTNADDLFDLYHALRRALYPEDLDERQAIRAALVAAGAEDDPEFTQQGFGLGQTDSGPMLVGVGQIRVQMRTLP